MKTLKNGLTIIEILIAVFILAVFLTPMIVNYVFLTRQNLDLKSLVLATAQASNCLEKAKSPGADLPPPKLAQSDTNEIYGSVKISANPQFADAYVSDGTVLAGRLIGIKVDWNSAGKTDSGAHKLELHSVTYKRWR
ncbi:MAG: type II secretion system protein [Candidatus Riflebacteria bacterium]|nr:type II secretion system protein [Candidatus Riflebacteria bacterium]